MTDAAKEARRAYKRKWAQEHKAQVEAAQARFWEKKAAEMAGQPTEIEPPYPQGRIIDNVEYI